MEDDNGQTATKTQKIVCMLVKLTEFFLIISLFFCFLVAFGLLYIDDNKDGYLCMYTKDWNDYDLIVQDLPCNIQWLSVLELFSFLFVCLIILFHLPAWIVFFVLKFIKKKESYQKNKDRKINFKKLNVVSLCVALIFYVFTSVALSYIALDHNPQGEFCASNESVNGVFEIDINGQRCVLQYDFFELVGLGAAYSFPIAYFLFFISAYLVQTIIHRFWR